MVLYLIKTVLLLMGLTLMGFASLQLNDPDPIIWAGFYSICALNPLLLVFNLVYRPLSWLAVILSCVQLVIAGPGMFEYFQHMTTEPLMQSMNPDKPYIEEAREFLGVLIALAITSSSALIAKTHHFSIENTICSK